MADLHAGAGPRALAAPVRNGVLISVNVDGRNDGVLLFVEDGHLACLEIQACREFGSLGALADSLSENILMQSVVLVWQTQGAAQKLAPGRAIGASRSIGE